MKKEEINSDWIELEYGAHLNLQWLKFGLKILCSNKNYYDCAGKDFFKVNHRTTLYRHYIQRKAQDAMLQLTNSPNDDLNKFKPYENSIEIARSVFSILNEFSQKNRGSFLIQPMQNEEFYFESIEKQEIFIPFLLEKSNGDATPFYLSLSLNNLITHSNFKQKFNGFKRFVTAGCLFGASLQAIDKKGAVFPIIQHKIAFAEGEQIVRLNPPNNELHPYELAQFNCLKDNVSLMKRMANQDERVEVLYHLPHFDYVLSAIKLFIHNKISYEALLDFYVAVKERSKKHTRIIKKIFKNSEFTLRLESPFMNLLKDFRDDNYEIIHIVCLDEFNKIVAEENKIYMAVKNNFLVYKILSPTGNQEEGSTSIAYTEQEYSPQNIAKATAKLLEFIVEKGHARGLNAFLLYLGVPIQKEKFIHHKKMEQEVVKTILTALCNNRFSPEHSDVWRDILKIDFGRDKIRDIESLFKIANAVMIGVAAKGFEDYAVCSFLPFNEKPIFNKYKRCNEQFASSGILYPEVFSLTRLEDLIFYSHISKGNVFYFQPSSSRLGTILNSKEPMNYNELIDKVSVLKEKNDQLIEFDEVT